MQWGIGFARGDIQAVVRNRKLSLDFKWLPQKDNDHFIADPFIFTGKDGNIFLLHEDFGLEKNGLIMLTTLDREFNVTGEKLLLKTRQHLSYPFVFEQEDTTYVIPESHQKGTTGIYQFDPAGECLVNERPLINLPLLDATMLKHNGKFWIFAGMGDGVDDNKKLYIFFSSYLMGPYQPHPCNPVRNDLNGSRPAGNFFSAGGEIYRPAQNCGEYYGKSISINKVLTLSVTEYKEKHCFDITAEGNREFKDGIHTINVHEDIIVIDGIRLVFAPFSKLRFFLKKRARKKQAYKAYSTQEELL